MKNHVFRPLWVVVGIVVLILIARVVYVPKSFGIHDRGYMYGWYREGNIDDWKRFQVKFQGTEYCKDCHSDKYESIKKSPHTIIPCEDCRGPAVNHPDNPPKLAIDRNRGLCLRCHVHLSYPTSDRANIRGFDNPDSHNPGIECVMCHNPHTPGLEAMK